MKSTFPFAFLLSFIFLFSACKESETITKIEGETMGTYYAVSYVSKKAILTKNNFDSLLVAINNQVSTYEKKSLISQINQAHAKEENFPLNASSKHFYKNFILAVQTHTQTEGYFDPTVMPLVNFWGFGYDKSTYKQKDTTVLKELVQWVDFSQWEMRKSGNQIKIAKPEKASLDFSALAKGYAVDELANLLEEYGIKNYLVDIGGESKSKGFKAANKPWIIGINTPLEDAKANDIELLLNLKDHAIATSGNYRNFYVENGQKYVHTINPKTGYPEKSQLLSASIIHPNCAIADALATACMVMGTEKSIPFLTRTPNTDGLLLYLDDTGKIKQWRTKTFDQYIVPLANKNK